MRSAAIVLVATLVLVASGFAWSRRMTERNIQVNTKGMPEHGLVVISPSDPAFDAEISKLLSGKPDALREAIEATKPFCVLLRNTGSLDVIMYSVKWELVGADGMTRASAGSFGSPGLLLGMGQPTDPRLVKASDRIRPGEARLVSIDSSLKNLVYGVLNHTIAVDAADKEAVARVTREYISYWGTVAKGYTQSVISVTATFDGAIYEDGSFVGSDESGLYARAQALVESRRDLALDIDAGLKAKQSPADILARVRDIAQKPERLRDRLPSSGQASAPDRNYDESLKRYAKQLSDMAASRGDEAVFKYTRELLSRESPKLHKKGK